jgi:hypothetical protein
MTSTKLPTFTYVIMFARIVGQIGPEDSGITEIEERMVPPFIINAMRAHSGLIWDEAVFMSHPRSKTLIVTCDTDINYLLVDVLDRTLKINRIEDLFTFSVDRVISEF